MTIIGLTKTNIMEFTNYELENIAQLLLTNCKKNIKIVEHIALSMSQKIVVANIVINKMQSMPFDFRYDYAAIINGLIRTTFRVGTLKFTTAFYINSNNICDITIRLVNEKLENVIRYRDKVISTNDISIDMLFAYQSVIKEIRSEVLRMLG